MPKNPSNLEQLIYRAKYNLSSLSRAAGVDKGTIRRALDGHPIRGDKAYAICEALTQALGEMITPEKAGIQIISLT